MGVTLYKAATGDVPFTHPDWFELARMHVEDPAPPVRRRRPELSKRFERIVARCLAKHPDDRYSSAAELSADLARVRERATDGVRVLPSGADRMLTIFGPPGKVRWGRLAVLGLALLLLLLLALTRKR